MFPLSHVHAFVAEYGHAHILVGEVARADAAAAATEGPPWHAGEYPEPVDTLTSPVLQMEPQMKPTAVA